MKIKTQMYRVVYQSQFQPTILIIFEELYVNGYTRRHYYQMQLC